MRTRLETYHKIEEDMEKMTIEITKKEYYNLKSNSLKLNFLECGGVDNWSSYGDSLSPDDEESFWDLDDKLREETLN